jgi:hypothetical protein
MDRFERERLDICGDAVDLDVIGVLRELDMECQRGILRRLISGFLADAPRQAQALVAAAGAGDAADMIAHAGTLRAAAFLIGANPLLALCARIERCAKMKAVTIAQSLTAQVPEEVTRACGALASILGAAA